MRNVLSFILVKAPAEGTHLCKMVMMSMVSFILIGDGEALATDIIRFRHLNRKIWVLVAEWELITTIRPY